MNNDECMYMYMYTQYLEELSTEIFDSPRVQVNNYCVTSRIKILLLITCVPIKTLTLK